MKVMVAALGMCGITLAAKGRVAVSRQDVVVYVANRASIQETTVYRATNEASAVYAEIGIRLAWREGIPPAAQGCHRTVAITIVETAPEHWNPAALAFTRLSNGAITVFYDRVRLLGPAWGESFHVLLGQVFAHEIAHSLQGFSRHSDEGIMKARWNMADYFEMRAERLRFTPLDAGLIRAGADPVCPVQ